MSSLSVKFKNMPFRIERDVCVFFNKLLMRFLKHRPSSAPYLSGDTYRAISSQQYDEIKKCTPSSIKQNDIVFVSSRFLDEFIEHILPFVTEPFIMITHQGDENITVKYASLADNRFIKHWFAQNCTLKHSKVTALPIGLQDRWQHNAGEIGDFKKLAKKNPVKQGKIVLAFSIFTNTAKRQPCYDALKLSPLAYEFPQGINCRIYRKELCKYMFVASPPGNGLDCHRLWEALYLKVIPIVEDNDMNRFFASLGLPLVIVENWSIPASWTESQAMELYHSLMTKANFDAAFFAYWKAKFFDKQREIS